VTKHLFPIFLLQITLALLCSGSIQFALNICSGSTRFAREFCVLSVFKKFSAKRDILVFGNTFRLVFASKKLGVEFLKEIGSAQNFQGVPG